MAADNDNYDNLSEFFRREYHSLNGFVRSRIEDSGDRQSEDIIQDVALRLFARADDLSPIRNIAGLVYRALRNRIIDTMRTRKKVNETASTLEDRWSEFAGRFYEPDREPFPDALLERLSDAIGTLKPEYRAIILAVDFENYTYRELAEQTGISPGTLMSRRHRALSQLHGKLKTHYKNE